MEKIILNKETVEGIFKNSNHQSDCIIAIYKLVFPDWDNITKLDGWPTISKETNEYFFDKFIAFDQKHHPRVLNGGLWMNNGFSSLEGNNLEFLEVDKSTVKNIEYKSIVKKRLRNN